MHTVIILFIAVLIFLFSSSSFANPDFENESGLELIERIDPIIDAEAGICKLRGLFEDADGSRQVRDYVSIFDDVDGCNLGTLVYLKTPILNHDLRLIRRFFQPGAMDEYLRAACTSQRYIDSSTAHSCHGLLMLDLKLSDHPYAMELQTNSAPDLEVDFVVWIFSESGGAFLKVVLAVSTGEVELRSFQVRM